MGWLNGRNRAEAEAVTPAPAPAATTNGHYGNGNDNPPPPPLRMAAASNGAPRFVFKEVVKYDAKLRLALSGPGGSGKTYTLLKLATELGGRIAFVDTEHGSASKYADIFKFDVLELDDYDPRIMPDLIDSVAAQGYATLITDSWSHFWMGQGGELEQVDKITARSKSNNSWAAWRDVSPMHNKMIDAMLSAPIHIMVSMRVKTEWIVEKDTKGKSVPRKVGLAPVMRDGVEYEFDVCGDMDQDNTLVVTKSRCPQLSGEVIQQPGSKMAATLREWLASPKTQPAPQVVPISTPATNGGAPATTTAQKAPWRSMADVEQYFTIARERAGETPWSQEMAACGWRTFSDIRNAMDSRDPETKATARQKARELYWRLDAIARKEGK